MSHSFSAGISQLFYFFLIVLSLQYKMADTYGLILLHGSGGTGKDFEQWISLYPFFLSKLKTSQFRFRFPSASVIKYTLAGGAPMSVWHDRVDLSPHVTEDTSRVLISAAEIDKEIDGFINEGIPVDKIFVLGFSMGGHMALQMAIQSKYSEQLAGVVALSCFISRISPTWELIKTRRRIPPILMIHGGSDAMVSSAWGKETADRLAAMGCDINFSVHPRLGHDISRAELESVLDWIIERTLCSSAT